MSPHLIFIGSAGRLSVPLRFADNWMVSRVGSFAFEPVGADAPKNVSPYELRAMVATGLRGRTYLAYNSAGQAVAVKVFRFGVGSDPKARARFLRAVTVARSMHCEFVAPVLGAGFAQHKLWQATEYQPGPSLADAVFRYGALPREGVRRLALALTKVVGELHLVGLSGRGLIPADVVLTPKGPRVVDLGFARVEIEGGGGEGTTSVLLDEIPGRYASNDAVLAEDVRDVAEILYFAATGRSVAIDPADILSPSAGNCPEALRELIAAGLRTDPGRRPRLAELAAAASTAGVPASTAANWETGEWLPKGVLQDAQERAAVVASIHRQHAWIVGGAMPEAELRTGSTIPGLARPQAVEDRRPSEQKLTAADLSKTLARKVWKRRPGA
jgi:serine/threonine protein kinase